jgi:hypothetical protein
MSAKEYLYGRKRQPSKNRDGTRTALYLRVSTAEQKPDLQYDGLRAYAARAGLQIVQDYCDTGVSGRREGRPQLNALMTAARNREIDCVRRPVRGHARVTAGPIAWFRRNRPTLERTRASGTVKQGSPGNRRAFWHHCWPRRLPKAACARLSLWTMDPARSLP